MPFIGASMEKRKDISITTTVINKISTNPTQVKAKVELRNISA